MKKLFTLILMTGFALMASSQGLINVNPDPDGEPWIAGGLRTLTPEDYSRIAATPKLVATQAQRSRDLPSSLDNSSLPWFRPVFNQDGGSCGQASGIGYNFTYEMDYVRNVAANTTETQYPTHYTWNFLNGGEGGGSWYFDGWQIIDANGCPNVQTYGGTPWFGGERRWMSGYDNYLSGMENRMLEVMTIDVSTVEGLQTLKQWMYDRLDGSASGGLANFSAGVSDVFTMNYLPSGTPNSGKQVITRWGEQVNHAMTFVGYDDNIRFDYNGDGLYTNDLDITGDGIVDLRDWEIGGLIMVNSWGDYFGNAGKAYVMYRTLALSLQDGGIWNNLLHVIRTRADYQPQLTFKTTVKHTSRQKIKITAGISDDPSATRPSHMLDFPIFSNQGGNYYMQGGNSEADKSIEIGLDVTPLLSYATPGQVSRYFLQVVEQDPENADSGEVTSLSVNDLNQSTEYPAGQNHVPIVNNDTTWVWADAPVDFTPAVITTEALPAAHAGVPYSTQLAASGAPGPYTWTLVQSYTENANQASYPAITTNQLTPSDNDDGFATQTIGFGFPFYGESYQNLVLTTDGSIAFGGQFEYIRSEAALRSARAITPYGTDLEIYPDQNDGIFYEGDASHATFRWKTSRFDNPSFDCDFAVTLYPDGTIKFYYGNGITPSTDWAAGISAGDNQNYLIASVSGSSEISAGSSYRFQCPPLPTGMSLSSDGIFSGIPTETNNNWDITFRARASNKLFADRTLNFSTESELLVEPDSLIFNDDTQAYEGLSFVISNPTDHDVTMTAFDYQGSILLQDGQWYWTAWFWDPMPRVISPAEQLQIVVSLDLPVMMQPMLGYAIDTLNFATESDNYTVILVFNDTINIYSNTHLQKAMSEGLRFSPNPANGTTCLHFMNAGEAEQAELTFLNTEGMEVKRESLSIPGGGEQTRQLDISGLSPGLYLVNLRTVNRSVSSKLIIR